MDYFNIKVVIERFLIFLAVAVSFAATGKDLSTEQEIVKAIEAGDWIDLKANFGKGNIPDGYLNALSRFAIGVHFNRPDESIPAYEDLLENYPDRIRRDDRLLFGRMHARDLSRIGRNKEAAALIDKFRNSDVQSIDASEMAALDHDAWLYSQLAEFFPYQISISGNSGEVPFHIEEVGDSIYAGRHIHLDSTYINSKLADAIFDTGASVNVISEALVEDYDMIPLEVEMEVQGVGVNKAILAMAKEVKLGNITFTDVPFYIMKMTANDEQSDQHFHNINIILGSELMSHLKDFTIDFVESQIQVNNDVVSRNSAIRPNIYLNSSMLFVASGSVMNTPIDLTIDTGDARYGTLGSFFYKRNKKFIKKNGHPQTIRRSGLGGVTQIPGYILKDISLNLGGDTVKVPTFEVYTKDDVFGNDCNLGLKSLMLYTKVRFNLVDCLLTCFP